MVVHHLPEDGPHAQLVENWEQFGVKNLWPASFQFRRISPADAKTHGKFGLCRLMPGTDAMDHKSQVRRRSHDALHFGSLVRTGNRRQSNRNT